MSFIAIFRFLILPMFLFSGTFFPISTLPTPLEVIAWFTPLWHGVTLCRDLTLGDVSPDDLLHLAYLLACVAAGLARGADHVSQEARRLMSELVARARLTAPARPALGGLLIIERNVMVYRRTWMILFSGFFEPLFYLFFFVYPLQKFIGDVTFEGESDRVRGVRRTRAARVVGDERRVVRRDERLLEAALRRRSTSRSSRRRSLPRTSPLGRRSGRSCARCSTRPPTCS